MSEEVEVVTEAMIEAGLAARDSLLEAMVMRNASEHPERLPDYDEGDVCIAVYRAMHESRIPSPITEEAWQFGVLPKTAGVCAYGIDECTVTLALDNAAEVMALVALLPGKDRAALEVGL